jgi:uncharacterized protein YbaR (Trm112 family)
LAALHSELKTILACPRCKGPLDFREPEEAIACPACRLLFPIREGLPVMLIDEATPMDAP